MSNVIELSEASTERVQYLIRLNLDAAKGLREVADELRRASAGAADLRLDDLFRSMAEARESNAARLQVLVAIQGEDPESEGTVWGAAHRWWLGVRSAFSTQSRKVLLVEAERGEKAIVDLYEESIRMCTEIELKRLLDEQLQEMSVAHQRLRDLLAS